MNIVKANGMRVNVIILQSAAQGSVFKEFRHIDLIAATFDAITLQG